MKNWPIFVVLWATTSALLLLSHKNLAANSNLDQHVEQSGIEVRVKCDSEDQECSKHVETLKGQIAKHLMDTVKVIVDTTAAVGDKLMSAIHIDGLAEESKFDIKSGWAAFKKSFENVLARKHQALVAEPLIKIASVEDFDRALAQIGSDSFFLAVMHDEKHAQKFSELVKTSFGPNHQVLHLNCDAHGSQDICNLLSVSNSAQQSTIALMTSDFTSKSQKTFSASSLSQLESIALKFFEENQKSYSGSLKMYYAPWCGHCKRAKPLFLEAKTQIESEMPGFSVDTINCDENRAVCNEAGVKGYPTIILNGYPYQGRRTTEDFVKYAKEAAKTSTQSSPMTQIMTPSQIASYLRNPASGNRLLILAINRKVSPRESLKLIQIIKEAHSKHESEFAVAFAITGINPAFDAYLGINSNYRINLVMLSEGARKNYIGNLDEVALAETVSNLDMSKDLAMFSAQPRDPVMPFKSFKVYLPFSTNFDDKVEALNKALAQQGLNTVPIYDFNSVSYLIENEKLVKLEVSDVAQFSGTLPDKFTTILQEIRENKAQKDL